MEVNKKVICIASSMRSGSTLLKALLATREDVSDLQEKSFKYLNKPENLSNKPIVVLKSPAYYNQYSYPDIPAAANIKKIILVRNPYDTILSLHKMNLVTNIELALGMNEEKLLKYWHMVYRNILEKISLTDINVLLVRYEELVRFPMEETERIFCFIQSENRKGTMEYKKPQNYEWKWGTDDGGDVIKTLKVKYKESEKKNIKLLNLVLQNKPVMYLLKKYGYQELVPKSFMMQ